MRRMHGVLNGGERYTYSRYKEWEIERGEENNEKDTERIGEKRRKE